MFLANFLTSFSITLGILAALSGITLILAAIGLLIKKK